MMKISEHAELMKGLSPNKIWFTSDTHFYHNKIVEYCQRPFASVEEMNEELIARWNDIFRWLLRDANKQGTQVWRS